MHGKNALECDMRESEIDKINAALHRAEFALEELQKKTDELRCKLAAAIAPDEILTLRSEAAELERQLRNIREAVHSGSLAPHLRLVRDTE